MSPSEIWTDSEPDNGGERKFPSLPSNYVTLQQLQDRRLKEQLQRQKEKDSLPGADCRCLLLKSGLIQSLIMAEKGSSHPFRRTTLPNLPYSNSKIGGLKNNCRGRKRRILYPELIADLSF
ncbi:hypothetical protein NE237_014705 [Protea cynaroides]|uniref:Uncharacterized protein n=1 Tax=Protea cynaroides TaxID=273540 RepID=A0A9Q0KCR4_9MAGN|nr:hypothetical protein NE237_014705 [Protea cynaroides]